MVIQPVTENPSYPFIIIDDFYDSREQQLIWQELDYYWGKFVNENQDTTGARANQEEDGTGKSKNSSFRVYLDKVYSQEYRYFSNILSVYKKILNEEVIEAVKEHMPTAPMLGLSNSDCSQISYYDTGDFYEAHRDLFDYTVLVWFFKEPKKFAGGTLVLPDSNQKIECKHNRLVMIPSFYLHAVTPIKMSGVCQGKGLGRYTLTHFYWYDRNK